jgi:uncharacterized phage protein (TIGR01671 family)
VREIKFRAWDKEHRCMIENVGIQTEKYADKITISSSGIFVGNKCNSMVLMQFTGLRDKNGREIYEGDIVAGWFNNQKIVGQVFYGSNAAFFIQRKGLLGISLINADIWLEVIGNIYENPELLKAQNNAIQNVLE